MFETLKNAWKVQDLRKKILYTAMILLVFRIGASIPVPFIDTAALSELFAQLSESGSALSYLNIFTGGGLSNATLFAMSISPYINASIILQLLTVAIPALEAVAKEGEEGRRKIASWTRYLTVVIGLIQGFSYYVMLRNYNLLSTTHWLAVATLILTFMAGSAVVMWLGEHITEHGIGNGISIILFAGILSRGPQLMQTFWVMVSGGTVRGIVEAVVMVLVGLFILTFIVYMQNAERRIPIQYAKRVVGRKVYGGQATHLPIKVNATGVMPIIFTSSILSIPASVEMFWSAERGPVATAVFSLFQQTSPFYIVLYALLIVAFSYFYASVQFNPIEIANNLQKNGGFIPGFRPGKPTADFITKALSKVVLVGAFFLGVVAIVPLIIGAFSSQLRNVAVGGTSVIIVVGVALETMQAVEAQLMMRHHKGFLE